MANCDKLKKGSKAWHKCMKKGIPEAEIPPELLKKAMEKRRQELKERKRIP